MGRGRMNANTASMANGKASVLFVDDEPRVLTTMRMLFRNAYELHFANSGAEALDLLRAKNVDVIVSDQRMPGMSGIELLREARSCTPNAMRILLTGYSDLNAIIGSINEGEIFRFVAKPWANEELSGTVAKAVAAARAASADTHVETAAPETAGDLAPALLVLDDDPNVALKIQAILGAAYRVFGARRLADSLDLLEREHIGVILSETRVDDHPVLSLIGALKKHRPELVSVILTERADAAAAIELINQGQIFRLITKPIQDAFCKITVSSALRQHRKLAHRPELHRRYEVEAPRDPVVASIGARLIDRIRSLRSLIGPKSA